ncbi:hypothetical protein PUMCH_002172 [Australozyma saopauloensis]|uniref:4'-phosphopantetheinyl transferase domain-containing protein n=1 Tax=Australozyma saopauloensis TaxID=291208 RepID=A0AAX4H8K0_9ASCO|nr:hypothetical protein PUMCH_002172 [[Candida] saopauloensis]
MKIPITRAIGVDLIRVDRIAALLAKPSGTRFLQRVLHPSERSAASKLNAQNCATYVAGCWATKEAIFKSLPAVEQHSFQFNRWYRFLDNGRPIIGSEVPHSDEFLLSISHDDGILVATVLRQEYIDIRAT